MSFPTTLIAGLNQLITHSSIHPLLHKPTSSHPSSTPSSPPNMRVLHLFRFPTPPAEAVHKTRPSAQTATATAFHHQITPSPSDASRIHPPPDIDSVYDQVCFTLRRYSTPTNGYSSHSDASSWTWNLQDEIQAVCGDLVVLPHPTPPASTFVHTQSNYYTSTLGSVPSFTSHVVNNPQSMLTGMAAIDPDCQFHSRCDFPLVPLLTTHRGA